MGQVASEEQTTLEEVALWEAGLEALHARIAPHFARRGTPPPGPGPPERTAGAGGTQERLATGRVCRG